MSEQFNFRLDAEYSDKLKLAASIQDKKVSTIAGSIVKKSLDFWEKKQERGEITQPKFIISKYMQMLDPSKIDEYIESIAEYIIGEMQIQVGNLTLEEFESRIQKWSSNNSIAFAKFDNPDRVTYISKHDIGKCWSEVNCKVYMNIFEKLGETILSHEFNETTFSIELSKH